MAIAILDVAAMTNELAKQSDALAAEINRAQDAEELERAACGLMFVAGVWDQVGYGYKVNDLAARVEKRAKVLADGERNYIAGLRKNDRTMASSRKNLARLEAMETATLGK